jgi:hypothetical protein
VVGSSPKGEEKGSCSGAKIEHAAQGARLPDLPVVKLERAALDGGDLRGIQPKEQERIRPVPHSADVALSQRLLAGQAPRIFADQSRALSAERMEARRD